MDLRNQLVNNVLEKLSDYPNVTMEQVEYILLNELQNYEVSERCTEVTVYDESSYGLINKFIATKKLEGKSPKTLRKYKRELEHLALSANEPLQKMETFDLRFYLFSYKEKRKISNRSLDNIRKTLSSFYSWLHDEGFISRNPMKAIKQIKYELVERKPFTSVDRDSINKACTCARDSALTSFLYSSGLRVSEVSSLDRNSIDFVKREGIVRGKGNKQRKFYIDEVCAKYLNSYLNSRTDSNPALFVSTKAPFERLSKEGIESAVKRIGKRANVENVHPHRFRRTLATDLVKKGVPIQFVAEILGHSDLRTTQVYVCLDKETTRYHYNRAVA